MNKQFLNRVSILATVAALAVSASAFAGVGEPTGAGGGNTFSIKITQGGTTIVDSPNTPFPGNIKTDPLSAVQIGTTSGGTPIILKIQSDFGPVEDFRITHWYISTPINLANVSTPSNFSLIDPNNLNPIKVEIGNIKFTGTPGAAPLVVNNNSFSVSYMIDSNGRYYKTPGTNNFNDYGLGKVAVQVPGEKYLDGAPNPYQFTSVSGAVNSWVWDGILPPGTTTDVVGNGGLLPGDKGFPVPGHVFELGLGVAFVEAAPEPATLAFVVMGGLMIARRHRPA